MSKKVSIIYNGILKENPVFVLLLGLCPALAVSTDTFDAIGMGLATTFVLVGSNTAISLIRQSIPNKVRIPCFIVLIAGFTTVVRLLVQAYVFDLYTALGIFLPLIAVNCIVFARAEIFASKNNILDSIIDAISVGIGFTLAMFLIASLREIFGNGTWFKMALPFLNENKIEVFVLAPGGFIVFGLLIAIINKISNGKVIKRSEFNCERCPSKAACAKISTANTAKEECK
ncbi:MAG: electron transport complex subunit E [Treponema sp.]|nr:electron transport complex subunit E [Treponema sp.]